jgi:hypothetical protein
MKQIAFNFVEESPGRGAEDISKDCEVNCLNIFFLSSLFGGRHVWKNHNQLKRTAVK